MVVSVDSFAFLCSFLCWCPLTLLGTLLSVKPGSPFDGDLKKKDVEDEEEEEDGDDDELEKEEWRRNVTEIYSHRGQMHYYLLFWLDRPGPSLFPRLSSACFLVSLFARDDTESVVHHASTRGY